MISFSMIYGLSYFFKQDVDYEMIVMMTKDMKELKAACLDAFVAETTNNRSVVEFSNALYCVGILKKPRDHLDEGVNNVILRVFGVNMTGDKFVEHASLALTFEELPYLRKCIDYVLSKKPY